MSRAAFTALGLGAMALAGAIALQLRGIGGDEATSGVAAAAVARWRPAPAVPTPPAPDRSREWAATALARPLFAPDRKPVPEPRPAAVAGGPGRDLPRLAGVLVTPAGGSAIFAAAGENAKPLVLRVGDKLSEFEVKAIVAGEVVLTGPDGDRVVRPSFDPRGTGAGGAPRPAPPVAAPPAAPTGFVPAAAAPGAAAVQLAPGFPLGNTSR